MKIREPEALSAEEQAWVLQGMAWAGLRRWRYGRDAGEQAWEWFGEQMDLRFDAKHASRHVGPAMERLEDEIRALVGRDVYQGATLLQPGTNAIGICGAGRRF